MVTWQTSELFNTVTMTMCLCAPLGTTNLPSRDDQGHQETTDKDQLQVTMQILCACHSRLGPKNGICGKVNLGDGGFQCLQRITDLPICFVLFISATCTCSTDMYVAHNFRQSIKCHIVASSQNTKC